MRRARRRAPARASAPRARADARRCRAAPSRERASAAPADVETVDTASVLRGHRARPCSTRLRRRRYRPRRGPRQADHDRGARRRRQVDARRRRSRASSPRAGASVELLREPGGVEVSERIRALVKDPALAVAPRAEALLYAAARAQLVQELLAPLLEQGTLVLLDRFVDSSLAYQGAGRALGVEEVRAINVFATAGLTPDRTLLLRIDPAAGTRAPATSGRSSPTGWSARASEFFASDRRRLRRARPRGARADPRDRRRAAARGRAARRARGDRGSAVAGDGRLAFTVQMAGTRAQHRPSRCRPRPGCTRLRQAPRQARPRPARYRRRRECTRSRPPRRTIAPAKATTPTTTSPAATTTIPATTVKSVIVAPAGDAHRKALRNALDRRDRRSPSSPRCCCWHASAGRSRAGGRSSLAGCSRCATRWPRRASAPRRPGPNSPTGSASDASPIGAMPSDGCSARRVAGFDPDVLLGPLDAE